MLCQIVYYYYYGVVALYIAAERIGIIVTRLAKNRFEGVLHVCWYTYCNIILYIPICISAVSGVRNFLKKVCCNIIIINVQCRFYRRYSMYIYAQLYTACCIFNARLRESIIYYCDIVSLLIIFTLLPASCDSFKNNFPPRSVSTLLSSCTTIIGPASMLYW